MTAERSRPDGRATRWAHRRPELLAAATEYVLEHGVTGLTLRPMASAMGVTITTLIRQFGSKDALLREITVGINHALVTDLREDPRLVGQPPVEALRVLWQRWLDPREAREFALMFELYGLAIRDPDGYRWFLDSVVADWLPPLEDGLMRAGGTREQARITGTVVLALLRGLHLDLIATGDTTRVNAAFDTTLRMLATATSQP